MKYHVLWLIMFSFIFLDALDENDWLNIEIPTKSYFRGFKPPNDAVKWKQAIDDARSGKLLLLEKVMKQIKYPDEVVSGDTLFSSIQRIGDIFISDQKSLKSQIRHFKNLERAPIVFFGYRDFQNNDNFEGDEVGWNPIGATNLLKLIRSGKFKLKSKIVGIGGMDENWGYLSSHFLNRTAVWGFGFTFDLRYSPRFSLTDQMRPFLDDPNLIVFIVNQHHNVSHPKVISLPRGMLNTSAKILWDQANIALKAAGAATGEGNNIRKHGLLVSASSTYGHRPAIISCVKQNMGKYLSAYQSTGSDERMEPSDYYKWLISSYAVLALPGLGYDCYRIWETLLSGSMPVLERGTGLDRTLYRLPALLLDDFADATPAVIRQAYVEALYRIDEWDYTRVTEKHWLNLVFNASKTGNHLHLLQLHPMKAEDATFTRPLIPYDCEAIGSCGEGTKRVPKKSCGIDFRTDFKKNDWNWFDNLEAAARGRKNEKT